jgi:hypothetical protein
MLISLHIDYIELEKYEIEKILFENFDYELKYHKIHLSGKIEKKEGIMYYELIHNTLISYLVIIKLIFECEQLFKVK